MWWICSEDGKGGLRRAFSFVEASCKKESVTSSEDWIWGKTRQDLYVCNELIVESLHGCPGFKRAGLRCMVQWKGRPERVLGLPSFFASFFPWCSATLSSHAQIMAVWASDGAQEAEGHSPSYGMLSRPQDQRMVLMASSWSWIFPLLSVPFTSCPSICWTLLLYMVPGSKLRTSSKVGR